MSVNALQVETESLQNLQPLSSLNSRQLHQLARQSELHALQHGEELHVPTKPIARRLGEDFMDFLVKGDVECVREHHRQKILFGTRKARQPLHEHMPHYQSLRAVGHCIILRINVIDLENLLSIHWEQGYEYEELQVESDMHSIANLLQNRCLLGLPPDNIETVFALMETVEVLAGEQVITQGELDDGYYTVLHGQCEVTRKPDGEGEDVLLAEIGPGASFGEEALITGAARNASIRMLTDGNLMRLNKKNFLTYVVEALLDFIDYDTLIIKLRSAAHLIDVRNRDEYRDNGHGVNIPLPMLRLHLQGLSKDREYIFCCNDGKLATTASFIATQHGFKSSVLLGGLNNVPENCLQTLPEG